MSKKPPQQSIDRTRDIFATLFPCCFAQKGKPKTPLKVGIWSDLKSELPEISSRLLRATLLDYTTGYRYHEAARSGAIRVGLDGSHCGVVDETSAAWHRSQIRYIKKKSDAKKRKPHRVAQQAKRGAGHV